MRYREICSTLEINLVFPRTNVLFSVYCTAHSFVYFCFLLSSLFNMVPCLFQKIREDYLTHLLTKTPVDVTEVYLYLEEIKDPAKTLQICERLLSKEMPVTSVIFIIQFMITDLAAHVKPARQRELLRHRLGANAMLCIPESNRNSYESLACRPLLLLEQLLIDMKVEWAGKVFEDLQTEIRTDKNYDELLGEEISVAFNRLLVCYATKALEFEVVTYEEKGRAAFNQFPSNDRQNV